MTQDTASTLVVSVVEKLNALALIVAKILIHILRNRPNDLAVAHQIEGLLPEREPGSESRREAQAEVRKPPRGTKDSGLTGSLWKWATAMRG